MILRPPVPRTFSQYHKADVPQFFSQSHFFASNVVLVLALAPIYAVVAGYFGLKIFVLLALSIASGFATECAGIFASKRSTGYMGFAVWLLFPLMTPPGMELWISVACLCLAIVITVIFFGGFGDQMFHPAVTAQVFLVVNFATEFGRSFLRPFIFQSYGYSVFSSLLGTDATALKVLKAGEAIDPCTLLAGPNTGFFSDAIPLLLIVCGVLYVIIGGVNRKTPAWFLLSFAAFSFLGNLAFPGKVLPVLPSVLSGSVLFYAFFIFSDRWTSAKTQGGRAWAGITAGLAAVFMRGFSSHIESIMFAALLVYVLTPLIDEAVFKAAGLVRKREAA
jgi:electron transport complex protein RnfD